MRDLFPHCKRRNVSALPLILCAIAGLFACYSYDSVRVDENLYITPTGVVCGKTDRNSLEEYETCMKKAKKTVFHKKKYFCLLASFSPEAEVNNAAVKLAVAGKTESAEMLFKEILTDSKTKAAASNNLGIICELSGRMSEAARMYASACHLEPDNTVFRRNAANMIK